MQNYEQGENAEEEWKAVRQKLITYFETNILTKLKTDLCDLDVCNYNHAKEGLRSKYYEYNLCLLCLIDTT